MRVEEFLFKLENPQVHTGKEINVIRKDFKKRHINICLVFPDKYEIGMSHYGIKVLYHVLNQMENVNAERCFLPEKKSINTFKEFNIPLFSLENRMALKTFDLIGFSLLSEMNYTNILQILELSQIPIKNRERGETFPIVAAGGISSVNPEPLREFIDFFAIGDGETIFPDIVNILTEAKDKKLRKKDRLELINRAAGIYVPSLTPVKKKGTFYTPSLPSGKIKKQIIREMKNYFPRDKVIVPLTNVVFNRLDIEIARGCPQNCRFCQARSYYAPYRARSVNDTVNFLKQSLVQTGFESFSLLSLSSGDYPFLKKLLELIPDVVNPCVSFSISSLRPSTISDYLLATISLFRRTGITIVPEAGSERLRKIINKNVSNEEIFNAVELAMKNNWQKIKLYFMIGLPWETMDDIDAIVQLIEDIVKFARSKKKKIKMHISFSPFVPKPHTPFQWEKMEDLQVLFTKISYIKKNLKKYRHIDLDFHDPNSSVVEAILARGDYRVGQLILDAYKKNEIYSAWDREFSYSVWEKLIKKHNLNEILKSIPTEEPLPWDFIEVNFKKDYLLSEYKKSQSAIPTPTCVDMDCKVCNGCIFGLKKTMFGGKEGVPRRKAKKKKTVEYNKVRIFYEKTGDFRFFSQLSMIKYIERLIRKSGIAFRCTEGFHPRIKISSLQPIPVFAIGFDEVVELFLDAKLTEGKILSRLNKTSDDFKFKRVQICTSSPSLSRDIQFVEYEITFKIPPETIKRITEILNDTDSLSYVDNKLVLKMDYSNQGQERFSKIYKMIDPQKKFTAHLIRKKVTLFNSPA